MVPIPVSRGQIETEAVMQRVSDGLNHVCEVALIIFLAGMTVVVFLEVIFRYVLHLPLFWTEELARYCLVWTSLLGAAVALKRGEHIAVTFFLERLPYGIGRGLSMVAQFSVAAILAVIIFGGIKLVMITSTQTSPALRIPMSFPYLSLPVSSAVMLFYVITSIIKGPGGNTKGDQYSL
jgi:TRAP-type C4-dicarboxylate transport system permease small subunit